MTLGSFPVDDGALRAVLDAVNTHYGGLKEDGTHELVGGDFTLSQLLQFYSGYDESKNELIQEGDPNGTMWEAATIYRYPDPQYTTHDLIHALVDEIMRLRKKYEHDENHPSDG